MPGARPRRGVRDAHPAAAALHLMAVVLGGLRPRLGQVRDLAGVPHPQVSRAGSLGPIGHTGTTSEPTLRNQRYAEPDGGTS